MIMLLAWPLMAAYMAWVLSFLWLWFAVPLGAPDLGLAHLYGVALLVGYLTTSTPKPDGSQPDAIEQAAHIFAIVVRGLLTLAAGWVAWRLMGGAS